jgi:hypothetical protein
MPDRMDWWLRRLILFLFKDIFFILFYILFSYFKVLDIILKLFGHGSLVKENYLNYLEEVLYIQFYLFFFLEGKGYYIPFETVMTGILDMRPGKHNLHFLLGVELLPHAFVNIPDEKMQFKVFLFLFFIYFAFFLYILKFIHIHLFIVFFKFWSYNSH